MPEINIKLPDGRTMAITMPKGASFSQTQLDEVKRLATGPSLALGGPIDIEGGRIPLKGEKQKDITPLSKLPFKFRQRLFAIRDESPGQLGDFLKKEGFEPLPIGLGGENLFKDKNGRLFDLQEALPGQAALQKGIPALLQTAGFLAPGAALPFTIPAGILAGKRTEEAFLADATGKPIPVSLAGDAADVTIGVGSELVFRGLGAGVRALTGKSALQKAQPKIQADVAAKEARRMGSAQTKREAAQQAYNAMQARAVESGVERVRGQKVMEGIEQGLGMTREQAIALEARSLEDFASVTGPLQGVKGVTQKAISNIYEGLNKKFDALLGGFREIKVQGQFDEIVTAQRDWAENEGFRLSPQLNKLLDDFQAMGGTDPARAKQIADLQKSGMPPEVIEQVASQLGGGEGATVDQLLGLRSRFLGLMRKSGNRVDRRAAANVVDSIDGYVNQVLPPDVQQAHSVLRQQWGQANILFNDEVFRSPLRKAGSPAAVVDAMLANPNKTQRALQIVNNTPKDELPILRAAFAERILTTDDPAKAIKSLNPALFQRLFPKSMASKPDEWIAALEGQTSLRAIADNPADLASFRVGYLEGMSSLGAKEKAAALAKAEDLVTRLGEGAEVRSAEAIARLEKAAVQKPWRVTQYAGNRAVFDLNLALLGTGLYFGVGPQAAAAPLALLGSRVGFSRMMESPRLGDLYMRALKAETPEKAGWFLGRIAASTLSREGSKLLRAPVIPGESEKVAEARRRLLNPDPVEGRRPKPAPAF